MEQLYKDCEGDVPSGETFGWNELEEEEKTLDGKQARLGGRLSISRWMYARKSNESYHYVKPSGWLSFRRFPTGRTDSRFYRIKKLSSKLAICWKLAWNIAQRTLACNTWFMKIYRPSDSALPAIPTGPHYHNRDHAVISNGKTPNWINTVHC